MGDRTIADAYVELCSPQKQFGLVVETKYADGFGARDLDVAHRNSYLALNERMQIWNQSSADYGTGKFDQLARVHALGSVTLGNPANLLVLHHPSDYRTPEVAEGYRRSLVDSQLLTVTDLRQFLEAMELGAGQLSQRLVVEALRLRYVDHHLSEESWLDWLSLNRASL
jgi:hypothetical protein